MTPAGQGIRQEVGSWPGVSSLPHRFGGVEYRYGRKEMGHVHGDRLADLPMPRRIHDEVIASGPARPRPVRPALAWATCTTNGPTPATPGNHLLPVPFNTNPPPCA